jgi:hypothetical protein
LLRRWGRSACLAGHFGLFKRLLNLVSLNIVDSLQEGIESSFTENLHEAAKSISRSRPDVRIRIAKCCSLRGCKSLEVAFAGGFFGLAKATDDERESAFSDLRVLVSNGGHAIFDNVAEGSL